MTSQVFQYRFSELKPLLCQLRYACFVASLTGRGVLLDLPAATACEAAVPMGRRHSVHSFILGSGVSAMSSAADAVCDQPERVADSRPLAINHHYLV